MPLFSPQPITPTLSACPMLRISVDHISLRDLSVFWALRPEVDLDLPRHWWFEFSSADFAVYPIAAGFLIEIRSDDPQPCDGDNSRYLSPEFFGLLKWACERGVRTLRLDMDIETSADIPFRPNEQAQAA